MHSRHAALLIVACCLAATPLRAAEQNIEKLHRLYDLSPVSQQNPVVARVAGCDIEIPVSEFRAYVAGLPEDQKRTSLTLEEKRARLQELLNEHFLLWDGYRQGA